MLRRVRRSNLPAISSVQARIIDVYAGRRSTDDLYSPLLSTPGMSTSRPASSNVALETCETESIKTASPGRVSGATAGALPPICRIRSGEQVAPFSPARDITHQSIVLPAAGRDARPGGAWRSLLRHSVPILGTPAEHTCEIFPVCLRGPVHAAFRIRQRRGGGSVLTGRSSAVYHHGGMNVYVNNSRIM